MELAAFATIVSGTTVLATEVLKGIASEAGKNAWDKIKSLFKWSADPAEKDLAAEIAKVLEANESLAQQVVEILQSQSTGTASTLVDSISVEKGSITVVGTNTGTISNTNTFN